MPTPQPQTLELVKTILRRDLKLGQNADIPDDMPFFGGDIDLDSLDILLLMTSIEKQFKIRVPSEAVGKQVFQNVTTLASYIDANGGASHEASLPVAPKPIDYLSRLPHGPEFRFITEVNQITESESGQAVWSVNGNESFLSGHFPGNPIVPGVLIVEALAQLSGLVGPDTGARSGKLAHVEVRFECPVVPPAQISLRSKFSRSMGDLQQFEVTASVNETVVASGTLALHRGTGQS